MFWMELLFLSERIRFFVKVSFAGVEVTILVFLHAGLDKRVLCVLSAPCRGGPQVPLHQWVQTGVGVSSAAVGARWTAWSTAAFLCMCVEMHVQTLELGGVCLGFTAAPQLPRPCGTCANRPEGPPGGGTDRTLLRWNCSAAFRRRCFCFLSHQTLK